MLFVKGFLLKSRSKYPKNFSIMLKSEKKFVQNDEILTNIKKAAAKLFIAWRVCGIMIILTRVLSDI